MKKELTMILILLLVLAADSLSIRQVFLRADANYLKTSFSFLLIAFGAGLLGMCAFFIRRLFLKQA